MASPQDIVLCLFERTTEPVFMPKGDKNIILEVPNEYFAEDYRPIATELKSRFSVGPTQQVAIKSVTVANIDKILQLPRRASFSLHIPMHRKIAASLVTTFMEYRSLEDFFSACAFCRDQVNPQLFVYAMSVAILHRPDTRSLRIPPLSEIFPAKFVDGAVFVSAREQAGVLTNNMGRMAIEIPQDYTANDLELEHRIAYFREDLGINLHHWHWHLVYPLEGPMNLVNKDRRGELFYYMHQQIIARYDFERMCNRLPRVKRLLDWYQPLEEAYFPKLDSLVAGRNYAPRHSGALLSSVNREVDQLKFDLQHLDRWRDRVYEAIAKGRIELPNGTMQPLTIDILGNMLEASILTPNSALYGDLHNNLHMAIAFCHDPDQRHLETFSVIGDPSTGMRDPAFYRLHAFINDMFLEHKHSLPRYTVQQLEYTGIRIKSVELVTPNSEINTIQTYWQKSQVELSRGMDFAPRGSVLANFTHLQHAAFQYRITVENTTNGARMGTVRIFLSPKFDERGQPWSLVDQKNMLIEMDRFVVNMKGNTQIISRDSRESTVTIPFEQTFRDLEANRPTSPGAALTAFDFCGCGWPQHMLVPKGIPEGLPCQLFVMISNYNDDQVANQGRESTACRDAAAFCGLRDSLYPDRRSMGYPFDRLPRTGVNTLEQFLTPNMQVNDISIRFTNRVLDSQTSKV